MLCTVCLGMQKFNANAAVLEPDQMRWHEINEPHIYQHPTCKDLYHCLPHDPEGLLGLLNSIVICFLGEESVHYCFRV